MRVKVCESEVNGRVVAPPSKSLTHRALVCSALAQGRSRIHSPLVSDDTAATRRVLEALGVGVSAGDDLWEVRGGELEKPGSALFCGESGTTLRFTTALCPLVDGKSEITGGESLTKRPIEPLLDGLRQLDVDCASTTGYPPVTVRGKGRIPGGEAAIRGDVSSQFVSALLIATPLADRTTTLSLTTPLESKPYVAMTMDAQRGFGVEIEASDDLRSYRVERQTYRPAEMTVEGDWSSAAYLLAAGAVCGEVTVENLNTGGQQADRAMMEILDAMGAGVNCRDGSISVSKEELQGVELDLSDSPDLFPIVSALSAVAKGSCVLRGLGRLRFKESDRLEAMVEGLARAGIKVTRDGDSLSIEGGKPRGRIVDPRKDHRIVMAFAVLGLVAEGETTILDAECVSKSYPGFWRDLASIGAEARRVDYE
jgi:3-phosphoshikimate 1-carboxyvinyltransferase